MPPEDRPPDTRPVALIALAALAWAIIALAFASLGPSEYVPRVFHNYHIEHFAAFYVVTLLTAAAMPRTSLWRICAGLAFLATIFALIRFATPLHRLTALEDLACDVGGSFAAITPILVGRFRALDQASAPPSKS
jgi:hypothetical protein